MVKKRNIYGDYQITKEIDNRLRDCIMATERSEDYHDWEYENRDEEKFLDWVVNPAISSLMMAITMFLKSREQIAKLKEKAKKQTKIIGIDLAMICGTAIYIVTIL